MLQGSVAASGFAHGGGGNASAAPSRLGSAFLDYAMFLLPAAWTSGGVTA